MYIKGTSALEVLKGQTDTPMETVTSNSNPKSIPLSFIKVIKQDRLKLSY